MVILFWVKAAINAGQYYGHAILHETKKQTTLLEQLSQRMHEQGEDVADRFQKVQEGIGELSMCTQQTQAIVTDMTASTREESASAVENGTSSTVSASALQ